MGSRAGYSMRVAAAARSGGRRRSPARRATPRGADVAGVSRTTADRCAAAAEDALDVAEAGGQAVDVVAVGVDVEATRAPSPHRRAARGAAGCSGGRRGWRPPRGRGAWPRRARGRPGRLNVTMPARSAARARADGCGCPGTSRGSMSSAYAVSASLVRRDARPCRWRRGSRPRRRGRWRPRCPACLPRTCGARR